jgi:hypothetical protein
MSQSLLLSNDVICLRFLLAGLHTSNINNNKRAISTQSQTSHVLITQCRIRTRQTRTYHTDTNERMHKHTQPRTTKQTNNHARTHVRYSHAYARTLLHTHAYKLHAHTLALTCTSYSQEGIRTGLHTHTKHTNTHTYT